jgi:cyclophilin family peptidyl-prolyl cis-trans isomerase
MRQKSSAFNVLITLVVASLAYAAAAQEKAQDKADKAPPTTPPAATEPAAAKSPAAAEYERLFEDWKAAIKELRRLKVQFQSAAVAEQEQIKKDWQAQVEKGNELIKAMQAAGLKAYAESPNEDPQLTRFLVKLADDAVQRDDYATAKEVSDVLIEHQCPEKQIYDSAAQAAFVLNDYDQAEKHFKAAKDAAVLSTAGREMDEHLKEYKEFWATEQARREAEAKADDLPRVKLTTSKGEIVIELFENEAPDTVGNFISRVEQGFYDGLSFHRVLKNFMAQGGDPKGDGSGGPGYQIYCEWHKPEARQHFQGSLSMAHAGRDTGGSQFFLTFKQTPHLNGKHTVFGRVIEGMDVLSKLQRRDPQAANPPEPDKIVKAEVLRKRDHAYQPNKVQ